MAGDANVTRAGRRRVTVRAPGRPGVRARALLVAYACHPERGSEPGVGWQRALAIAQHLDTWVICEANASRAGIERHTAEIGQVPGLSFVFVQSTRWQTMLRRVPGIGYLIAYNLWHRRAFRVAKKLHQELRFDLTHQITLCSYREPGYLWKLDVPFVWGPIGGSQNYPWRFLGRAGVRGALVEALRNVLNTLQFRWSRRVRRALGACRLLLVANSTNRRDFLRCHRRRSVRMLDTGAASRMFTESKDERTPGEPFRILWSGVFQHRKALHLLLEALGGLPGFEFELRILGEGRLERRWQRLARRLRIDGRCRWLGWLPQGQALAQNGWADLFIFTSLRDTSGSVVLEALAAGTPVVCFAHQGAGDIVTRACGVKIPVTSPQVAVDAIRQAILELSEDLDELKRKSVAARLRARDFLWADQGEPVARLYQEILNASAAAPKAAPELSSVAAAGPAEVGMRSASPMPKGSGG